MKNIIFIGQTNHIGGFNIYYEIGWAVDEDFDELIKYRPISINETTAEKIEALEGLSIRSRILLSAVAGAAIQYLLDNDIAFTGEWEIKVEKEA
jgi:hypothetical protein